MQYIATMEACPVPTTCVTGCERTRYEDYLSNTTVPAVRLVLAAAQAEPHRLP